jgi:hypothetical protein
VPSQLRLSAVMMMMIITLCFLLLACCRSFCSYVRYRGGNAGLDQTTVRQQYPQGRLVQWAAFSSTSRRIEAVRPFVNKGVGVIFRIKVMTGRDIGAYSYFPKENEVLLTPNTQFVVTSELYKDKDGYACIDLAEKTVGPMLRS